MKTLILYDDSGKIYLLASGTYSIPQGGIQFVEIEIPQGKILKEINVSTMPHQPIYEDAPVPEIQVVKQQLKEAQDILAEYIDNKYNALI